MTGGSSRGLPAMARQLLLLGGALLVLGLAAPCEGTTYAKVSEIRDAMYTKMQYSRACYKYLNATGTTGCETPNQKPDRGVLIPYSDLADNAEGGKVVVVPVAQFETLMRQILASPKLQKAVRGVLVNPFTDRPASQSSSTPFPNAAFAPYSSPSYVWNPYGSGLSLERFGFPIYFLTEDVAADADSRAAYNARNGYDTSGAVHTARMNDAMQGQYNSTACVENDLCLPVGSYSVWSALPPIPDLNYTAVPARPVTLVTCQLDADSLFHDLTRAANTAMSGAIAMLTAATLLAAAGTPAAYPRQLVFAGLSGESFGHMGSRRMLYEMVRGTNNTAGLSSSLITQVVSVGPIGLAHSKAANATSLYVHAQSGAAWGNAGPLVSLFQQAAAAEAAASGVQLSAAAASTSNPGIPPSPLSSFLRVNPSLQGVVLAEFDRQYKDPYSSSEWDDGTNMTVVAMVDASLVLARALHTLASGSATLLPLALDRSLALAVVSNLTQCLVLDSPGLSCDTATALLTPSAKVAYGEVSYGVRSFPGVLRVPDPNPRNNMYKPTLQRFVWNYLANLTAAPVGAGGPGVSGDGALCDMTANFCPPPLACVGWRFGDKPAKHAATMGRCRNTTTLYVPSYSTRFWFGKRGSSVGWWVVDDAAAFDTQYSWPPDPALTESNWQYGVPVVELSQQESEDVLVAIIVSGFLLTAATGVVSWLGRRAFEKHLKAE